MHIEITVSQEEKEAVIEAIKQLNKAEHVKHMSQSMIAVSAGIKDTKVRAILQELINEGAITQYSISENKRIPRYYYTISSTDSEE